MRIKQICYHLKCARHFRDLATHDSLRRPGMMKPGVAMRRAREHERRAALLFADGISRWQPAPNREAAYRRRYRARQPAGPGRGRRGVKYWGRHAHLATAAGDAGDDQAQ